MTDTLTFTLTLDAQDMRVEYRPCFAGYAHFEFHSPHSPPRRIPVSETGYCSRFVPMHHLSAFSSVSAYAEALALAILHAKPFDEEEDAEADLQLRLL